MSFSLSSMLSACCLTGSKRELYHTPVPLSHPYSWEDCKQLLLSANFFENLRFFDKDGLPKAKLRRLERMVERSSRFEALGHGSRAVLSLCAWLNALIDYHQHPPGGMSCTPLVSHHIPPQAEKTFVDMRRDMMEAKADLENTVKTHKTSVQRQKSVEATIEVSPSYYIYHHSNVL